MNRDTIRRAQEAHDDKHPPEDEDEDETIVGLRCVIEGARALLSRAEEHLDKGEADRACELMQDAGEDLMESWA